MAANGRIILIAEIGSNPEEKVAGRLFNSQEKGERLYNNPGHFSSWQSRDLDHPTQKRYGGAIRVPGYILSFSGLPELADETLCAFVAIKMGLLCTADAWRILAISDNETGQVMIEKLGLRPHPDPAEVN